MAFHPSRDSERADPTLGFMSYRLVTACFSLGFARDRRARLGKTPLDASVTRP